MTMCIAQSERLNSKPEPPCISSLLVIVMNQLQLFELLLSWPSSGRLTCFFNAEDQLRIVALRKVTL